ncbi:hypothetical protein [Pseudozobellia sp. WGM2]|nr:hypothetical protein [Pseudozobellia sp. WGM2]
MKATITRTTTESRRFTVLNHFKDSKRIRWAESRYYYHSEF